jgi:hypothetical protein
MGESLSSNHHGKDPKCVPAASLLLSERACLDCFITTTKNLAMRAELRNNSMFRTQSRHRSSVLAVVLLSAAAVHSHPLCQDFGAPVAQAPPLQFCKHVDSEVDGSLHCCTRCSHIKEFQCRDQRRTRRCIRRMQEAAGQLHLLAVLANATASNRS